MFAGQLFLEWLTFLLWISFILTNVGSSVFSPFIYLFSLQLVVLPRSSAALSPADCAVRCSQVPLAAEVSTHAYQAHNQDFTETRKTWAVFLTPFCRMSCFPHSRPFLRVHRIKWAQKPRSVNAIYMLLWWEWFGFIFQCAPSTESQSILFSVQADVNLHFWFLFFFFN